MSEAFGTDGDEDNNVEETEGEEEVGGWGGFPETVFFISFGSERVDFDFAGAGAGAETGTVFGLSQSQEIAVSTFKPHDDIAAKHSDSGKPIARRWLNKSSLETTSPWTVTDGVEIGMTGAITIGIDGVETITGEECENDFEFGFCISWIICG